MDAHGGGLMFANKHILAKFVSFVSLYIFLIISTLGFACCVLVFSFINTLYFACPRIHSIPHD